MARRQRDLRDSLQDGFTEDERNALQRAADIINVPCSDLIDLQRSQATSTRISNFTNSESNELSWAPDIPLAAYSAVQPFISGATNINVPASNRTFRQEFSPYNVFQASEYSPTDISTDSSTTLRSAPVPEVLIGNASWLQDIDLDQISMEYTLSSGLDFALDNQIQNTFEASNGLLDNYPNNINFPVLEVGAWYNQRSSTEAKLGFGIGVQNMTGTNMFSSVVDAAVGIEPTAVVNDGMVVFDLVSDILSQSVREASSRSPREMSTTGILSIDAGHRDALGNNFNQHLIQPLSHRPLHPASNPRPTKANHEASRAPRRRRRGGQGEVQKPKRKGPLEPDTREEAGMMRKIKACIRCHMQRSKVSNSDLQ